MGCDENDAEILSQYLARCCFGSSHGDNCSSRCSGNEEASVPDVLSRMKGPWTIIYWQVTLRGKFPLMFCKLFLCKHTELSLLFALLRNLSVFF